MSGDLLLWASTLAAAATLAALALGRDRLARWTIRATAGLLTLAFGLLVLAFLNSDFTLNYVWTFSSRDLPLLYKFLGAWAGQQGSLLYWALLIAAASLWLSETRGLAEAYYRRVQMVALALGLFFIGLTLHDSPFATIYQLYPEIPRTFVPGDGSGLNPLLQTPWMAIHPPLIFVGYATLTLPFALAVVYLYDTARGRDSHRLWAQSAVPWARVSWIFLLLGIAVGGVWSYEVLGWGGYWAWDPVETSSLIPWLTLTASLHLLVVHRERPNRLPVMAPLLLGISFSLVVYAALVTRGGLFESVHAFGSGKAGSLLLALTAVSAATPALLALAARRRAPREPPPPGLLNPKTLLFIGAVILSLLAFIAFWGITYPALHKLATGAKVAVTKDFFNLWSAPLFIALLLLLGFTLHYRPSARRQALGVLLGVSSLTAAMALWKPADAFTFLRYANPVGPEKSPLYVLIGSASALAMVPPAAYVAWGAAGRFLRRAKAVKSRSFRGREAGLLVLHLGILLVAFGSVFGSLFAQEATVSLNLHQRGPQLLTLAGAPLGIEVADYRSETMYPDGDGGATRALSLPEFYRRLEKGADTGEPRAYTVQGRLGEAEVVGPYLLLRLQEEGHELWIATGHSGDIPEGAAVVTGVPMFGFYSPRLNRTFDVILFAPPEAVRPLRGELTTVQTLQLAIYEDQRPPVVGTVAKTATSKGDASQVLIHRGLFRDIYVIFTGAQESWVPLTVKHIPLVSFVWGGVALLVAGGIAVTLFDPHRGRKP